MNLSLSRKKKIALTSLLSACGAAVLAAWFFILQCPLLFYLETQLYRQGYRVEEYHAILPMTKDTAWTRENAAVLPYLRIGLYTYGGEKGTDYVSVEFFYTPQRRRAYTEAYLKRCAELAPMAMFIGPCYTLGSGSGLIEFPGYDSLEDFTPAFVERVRPFCQVSP